MKQIWKKNDAVSPVIATILMVAITVVLAAVLYVMVIGFGGDTGIDTPMGLNQQGKNSTAVTILIASAPTGAKIDGTTVSVTQNGAPVAVSTVTVYNSAATVIATYSSGAWSYSGGETVDTATFTAGSTIVVDMGVGNSISNGDTIVFTSTESYFGTTTFTVQ